MKNIYQDSEMRYSEISTTLEKYTYGSKCKFSIPSITALINGGIEEITKNNTSGNIMNKEKDKLGIGKYTSSNSITLEIPLNLCPNCPILKDKCTHKGNKGDKFIATFLEGDINKCRIVGRY